MGYAVLKRRQEKLTHPLVSSCLTFKLHHLSRRCYKMVDLSKETIQELFYKQVRKLTLDKLKSFELQFSDAWI